MHFLIANIFLFSVIFLNLFVINVWANENKFITIVNPVRGGFLENSKKQWDIIKEKNLPATWLLRPDAIFDKNITDFFKEMPETQEKGLFMEVTPTWAIKAQISYHQNKNWHSAGSVFLSGYSVDERHKLIDTAFEKFKKEFGFYPKSVGAWWIDAGSLSYMKEKYDIIANMDVADQYSTDNYQVWGQYFSTPFYPAKRNALVPASGKAQKIGVVTIQWAMRDPFNAYGNGVLDSTYSVQANDYANKDFHKLGIDYFSKLISVYLDSPYSSFGQVTVGLENDFSWDEFGEEFKNQMQEISARAQKGAVVLTMSEFAENYSRLFPQVSPAQIIFADDPLGSGGKVVWFQNLKYRVGWFYKNNQSAILDLRIFHESHDEPCLEKACNELNMAMYDTEVLDFVTFSQKKILDEGKLSQIKVEKTKEGFNLSYINEAGTARQFEFLSQDIRENGKISSVSLVISKALEKSKEKIDQGYFSNKLLNPLTIVFGQIKNILVFVLVAFFYFYLPGLLILSKTELEKNHKFILAWVVGISIFTLVSFLVGFLRLTGLSLTVALSILPLISLLVIKKQIIIPNIQINLNNILLILVSLLGIISWFLVTVKNGLIYDFGMGFWGPHGHDGIWHLAVIESLKQGLPSQNPIFSGINLYNYHYFYDLLLANISAISRISAPDLYFREFPLFLSILLALLIYIVSTIFFKSRIGTFFCLFFVFFGGSFGWVVSFIRDKSLGGETLFWAQQGISTLINPPFAISLVLFLAGLMLFHQIINQKEYRWFHIIPLTIIWGSLIEFKAYAGVLVLLSLGAVTLLEAVKGNFRLTWIFLPIFILSLLVFLPNNLGSSSLFVFSPFWLVNSMVDFPDRLNWMRLTLMRISGFENNNYFKILVSEGIGFLIFIIGNLGMRIIGFLSFKRLWPINTFNLFMIMFLCVSLILSLLFIQKGANFNTIQFFYYFLFIFNFLTAFSMIFLWKKWKKLSVILFFLIILLTIPTTLNTLNQYLPSRPPARVSLQELEALNFLKNKPNGVVLSFYDKNLRERYTEPRPILAYETTAYVAGLSGKPEFIADSVNLEILGIDYQGRQTTQKDILNLKGVENVNKLLLKENIKYIYAPKVYMFNPTEGYKVKNIFENKEVIIYQVL